MGYHSWTYTCAHCNFEEMRVCTDGYFHLEMCCPICGYAMWTEEKVPRTQDVELAKLSLSKMSVEEQEKAIEQFLEDNIPLVIGSKRTLLNGE